jgi:protein O-mannosyl-transferase
MKLKPARQKLLLCLLLCLLAGIAWWPVTRCGFVALDDPAYVTGNVQVQAGLTLKGVAWAFSTSHSANWHPLTWLSHMLDAQVFGPGPAGPHIVNLLFHVANTLLLFGLLRRLTGAVWRSAFVAALFALHPLHVESVAWVSERKDVLSAFFFLLTLWAYGRYAEGRMQNVECRSQDSVSRITHHASHSYPPASIFYALSLLSFGLGLMSKPMLVTVPFVLLLLDYWPLDRFGLKTQDASLKTILPLLREKIPFFLLSALSSVVTYVAQHSGGAVMSAAELSLPGRIANALVSYVRYVAKLLWPANLACFYPRPEHWPVWQVAGAILVLAGITALVLRLLSSHRYLATGWFWFVGTLVPVIGLVQVGEQAMADRYTYIPSIGLFVLAAWGLGDLVCRWPRLKPLLVSFSVLALPGLLLVTRQQVQYWQTSEGLFRHALAVTEDNPWVHCLLADTLADAGDSQGAEVHCREALRLKPGFPEVQILYARVLARGKKFKEATAVLAEVLRQNPADAAAHLTLGSVLSQTGDASRAIEHYRQALSAKPNYAEAHFNLASLLAQHGDVSGAIDSYSRGLRWQPDNPDALNNLAWIRAANANPAVRNGGEAVQFAQRACGLTRFQSPMLVGTLAAAYAEAGRFEEAVATAQKARDLALASNQKELADRNQKLLELYQSHRAYHEPAAVPPPFRER